MKSQDKYNTKCGKAWYRCPVPRTVGSQQVQCDTRDIILQCFYELLGEGEGLKEKSLKPYHDIY